MINIDVEEVGIVINEVEQHVRKIATQYIHNW
jgi:hypothetical protein